MRKTLMILAMVLMLAPLVADSQTTTVPVSYTWTAPTTGSAVHHYDVQISSNGTTWTDRPDKPTTGAVTINATPGVNLQVRVRAVDAQNRTGIWSESSDPFVPDAGVPGVPGKPIRVP